MNTGSLSFPDYLVFRRSANGMAKQEGMEATIAVQRDHLSGQNQRLMQLALVWLLPVIGAVIVLAVNRPAEKATRKYREPPESGIDDM